MIAILGTAVTVISTVGAPGPAVAGPAAATGAAEVPELTECLSPLEVVGLDNCPELESGRGSHGNSTVQRLLDVKAEMLRQASFALVETAQYMAENQVWLGMHARTTFDLSGSAGGRVLCCLSVCPSVTIEETTASKHCRSGVNRFSRFIASLASAVEILNK